MPESQIAQIQSFRGDTGLIRLSNGEPAVCKLRQTMRGAVTGDQIEIVEKNDEHIGIRLIPRKTEFFRTDIRGQKKIIAANLDSLLLLVAPAPETHIGLIDRYLAGALLCGITPAIVINKIDLGITPLLEEVQSLYTSLGYDVLLISANKKTNLDELKSWISGKKVALIGQSGVGKSSLTNNLQMTHQALTATLSKKRLKGRHTTTSSHIYEVDGGGWIMDSPGIRDYHNTCWKLDEVIRGFPEIQEIALACQFTNCRHGSDKGCHVQEALKLNLIKESRFASYQDILMQMQQTPRFNLPSSKKARH